MSEKGKKNMAKGDNLESKEKLNLSCALSHCKNSHGGYALLCSAIRSGDTKSAKFLLRKGAKVDCKTDRTSLLHLALRLRPVDLKLIFLLLEKNALIDAPNGRKETPLHVAAEKGLKEIVRALLDNDANMTAQTIGGSTPLLLAAENGHEEVVCMLFEHALVKVSDLKDILPPDSLIEKRIKNLLLRIALVNGHKEFIQVFLNLRFNLNAKDEKGKTCLHYLVDRLEMVKLYLDGRSNVYCKAESQKTLVNMRYFVNYKEEEDCVEMLRLLFASGASITENPELLHLAVRKRLVVVCRVLIENGANVNGLDANGNTPLYLAVGVEDTEKLEDRRKIIEAIRYEIIKLLLNHGADVTVNTWNGLTAFHHAVRNGRKKAVLSFLNCGVNVDLCAEDDSTPLHSASEGGHTEIVKVLCENGANVDACRRNGWTPLHVAADRGDYEIMRILLDNGYGINAETNGIGVALRLAIRKALSDYTAVMRRQWYFIFGLFDEDDVDDFDPDEYDYVVTLKEHVYKLKAAGLLPRQNNGDLLIYMGSENSSHERKCAEEVSRIVSKKLGSQSLLRGILKTSSNLSPARTKFLVQTLESFNFGEFPIYGSLLKNRLEKSKFWLQLSILGQQSLDILVRASSKSNGKKCIVYPVELLELLISFLSITDLRSLISCGSALKHHKGH